MHFLNLDEKIIFKSIYIINNLILKGLYSYKYIRNKI